MELHINEDLLSISHLHSLPKKYENFRCGIESRDDLPKLDILKIKIIEEQARQSKDANVVDNTHYVNGKWKLYKKDKYNASD